MGGPGSGGGRGRGRSEADAGDKAGGREAGWPRPLPVLQRTLPPTCTRETLMLHSYDDCVLCHFHHFISCDWEAWPK